MLKYQGIDSFPREHCALIRNERARADHDPFGRAGRVHVFCNALNLKNMLGSSVRKNEMRKRGTS